MNPSFRKLPSLKAIAQVTVGCFPPILLHERNSPDYPCFSPRVANHNGNL